MATNVNPMQLEKFLKGVNYPANKQELVRIAEQQGADNQIRELLAQLPEQSFERPADVSKAVNSLGQRSARQ